MKRILSILIGIVILFTFSISILAVDIGSNFPEHGNLSYRFITYNSNTRNYTLVTTDVIMYEYDSGNNINFKAVGGSATQYTYYRDVINVSDANSSYYNNWTNTAGPYTTYNVYEDPIIIVSPGKVIWSNYTIYKNNDVNLTYFNSISSWDLGIVDSNGTITNFTDTGIINSLSNLLDGLNDNFDDLGTLMNSLLSGVSENIQSMSDALNQTFIDNIQQIRDALYITVDETTATITEALYALMLFTVDLKTEMQGGFYNIQTRLDEMKENLLTMIEMIDTLPEDIAEELDYLLNPENPNLPGSFGESISSDLQTKLPIDRLSHAFDSLESSNSPLSISENVTIGSLTLPINIDFQWYEPYRLYIRSGLGGVFWIMLLINLWSMISSIFNIAVNKGGSANIDSGSSSTMPNWISGGIPQSGNSIGDLYGYRGHDS